MNKGLTKDVYLYFRTVADEANDGVTGLKTNNPSSFMFDAENLTAMQPTSDTNLTLYFKYSGTKRI